MGTREDVVKARFVAQGHREKAKMFVVHNLGTLRQRSTRRIVSTSAVMDFRLFSHDITQAYLQSQDRFSRQLYLRPRPDDRHILDLSEGELLKIKLPLYGICDAGDYWQVTFTVNIEKDLGMTPRMSDISLFFKKHPNGDRYGMLGAYVDTAFMGGDNSFQVLSKKMLRRLQAKERTLDDAEYVGVRVSTMAGGERLFTLDQEDYSNNLASLPLDAPFYALPLKAGECRVAGSHPPRPVLRGNQAAQITEGGYGPQAMKSLSRFVGRGKVGRKLRFHFPPLDRSTLHLRV